MNDEYHHGNLREELIDKGLKLLDADGYDGFSLRRVARACGVSHTAPYRHFENKDELVAAIAAKALRQFNDCLKAAVSKYPGSTHDQIREMGCAYVRFFAERPEYFRLLFFGDLQRRLDGKQVRSILLERPELIFYDAIHRYAAEKSAGGTDGGPGGRALALRAWGLVHGISALLVQGDFPCDGDYMRLVRQIIWQDEESL